MKKFLISLIKAYQKTISPDKGFLNKIGLKKSQTCGFYPTCSDYSIEALSKYGLFKGLFLSLKRVLRCHPWQKNFIDPLE